MKTLLVIIAALTGLTYMFESTTLAFVTIFVAAGGALVVDFIKHAMRKS